MTDEKKPPQTVGSRAQIVLDINQDGSVRMASSCWGRPNSTFMPCSDERLLTAQIPFVLAELRMQIKLGRNLTIDESDVVWASAVQSLGEAVTA